MANEKSLILSGKTKDGKIHKLEIDEKSKANIKKALEDSGLDSLIVVKDPNTKAIHMFRDFSSCANFQKKFQGVDVPSFQFGMDALEAKK